MDEIFTFEVLQVVLRSELNTEIISEQFQFLPGSKVLSVSPTHINSSELAGPFEKILKKVTVQRFDLLQISTCLDGEIVLNLDGSRRCQIRFCCL